MKRAIIFFTLFFITASILWAAPITFDDMTKIKRVSSFSLSPDSNFLAVSVGDVLFDENRVNYNIFLINLKNNTIKQITSGDKSDFDPQWSSDGKHIYFLSYKAESPQVFRVSSDSYAIDQVTDFAMGVNSFYLSPDSRSILFTSTVYADCKGDDDCNKNRMENEKKSKVKAQVIDTLLYRHWDHWYDGKYSHLYYFNIASKEYHDVAPDDLEVPPYSLGGERDFDISHNGREIAFVLNRDKNLANSTNKDVYRVSTGKGSTPHPLTTNKAYDGYPRYSPDGRYIAYKDQSTPGFEADRFRLILYDKIENKLFNLTDDFDNWVEEIVWSNDSKYLYFTADEKGYTPIYKVDIEYFNKYKEVRKTKLLDQMSCGNLNIAENGDLYFSSSSLERPTDIYLLKNNSKTPQKITTFNDNLLSSLDLSEVNYIWYQGVDRKIQAWLLTPPNFSKSNKYPFLYLIHGGPQSVWSDGWSYRWNAQMFASRGYVVMMPNPTGSVGFGQDFINDITGNWGGRVYEELMKGADYAEKLPYVDQNRMGAAGGSFGGFMINWIEGHTDRFKALVSHSGVYNQISMYGSTEELWFPEWEFEGAPWENKALYEKWSPSNFVPNFKTPCLVIHGALDYRVPLSEGLQFFTALQKMGVDSKLLYFPDEGHWVLKQQNSKLWYNTILNWFDGYLK